MGWLCSYPLFPVSCLILLWVAAAGSVKVLHELTCFSDYLSNSTCEWQLDGPLNCSAELHLSYQLDSKTSQLDPEFSENHTCIPENSAATTCSCTMFIDRPVSADAYQLDLWAGTQRLWHGLFQPSNHVKPRAPENLTVHISDHGWRLLTWSNPYPPDTYLHRELTYLVNISSEEDPADFVVYNVTYLDSSLRLAASTLKSGVSYKARVRAWTHKYNGTWSEWSPSTRWHNYYKQPLEQHLGLGVSISCVVIVAICLSCYLSITKIKKEWWDQIPNPARSPLMAIVIQDSQVSLWERRPRVQEPTKCPHWKTCLAKLLPCLLEHVAKRDEDPTKVAGVRPLQGPGRPAWCPVEVSKVVLWPESISVAPCVEMFEAPVESEEAEVEDKVDLCTTPEGSGGFQEGREGIVARLTENLFLDLLGAEDGGLRQQGFGDSLLLPPSGGDSAQRPWAPHPGVGPEGSASGDKEPAPAASITQGLAIQGCSEGPLVVADNPAYRSFSSLQSQPPGPGELAPDPQLEGPCVPPPAQPPAQLQPEPETWEQILRQRVLQHQAATAPATVSASGYRELPPAVGQGGAPDSGAAGYKAFSSLLAHSALCTGTTGPGAGGGDRGYRPFQNLSSGFPGAPAPPPGPLFTFGLDTEPPGSPSNSLLPSTPPGHLGLQLLVKGEERQKPPLPPEPATDTLGDDLGSGIVYSAVTCHLCGHLKQHHGQEAHGQAHVVASPCCGCHCGDRSSPPGSPVGAWNPMPAGLPPEASLTPASGEPLGASDKSKSSLSSQPPPPASCGAQSASQGPSVLALVSTGPSS